MKHYLPHLPKAPRGPPRQIPPFHAVPVRQRKDGWTPLRQAEFIGHLAETRSVTAAAKAVSMARETAYRLRGRSGGEGFDAAWDIALARTGTERGLARYLDALAAARMALRPSRKVTLTQLNWRIETGIWQVILHDREYRGVRQKPDNQALLAVLRRVPVPKGWEWA